MRCLEPAAPHFVVDAREVSQPGAGDELDSPYVKEGSLALAGWANDALAMMLPAAVLCTADCLGLCSICGIGLSSAGARATSARQQPDSRWAKLSELKFD